MTKGTYKHYKEVVIKELKNELNLKNIMAVPRIKKITLNMGIGEAKNNKNVLTDAQKALTLIAGQKAVVKNARSDVSGFKIRKGMPIGAMVTLRRQKMWDFLCRLINIDIPRVKDFHGISARSFTKQGDYTLGLPDANVFAELGSFNSQLLKGLSISITTSADNKKDALALLKAVGMPFKR
ncbi:MAG TPA: 50S ribosomal protein L5 [Spirochaetota bacterium]|nr:50S ribosomal protein L5 [Spirochaetota bacterium]